MSKYIDREAFLDSRRERYCYNCPKRQGVRNGKMQTLYAIGEVPCRACDIHDVLTDVEDFPSADVVEVRHGRWIKPEDPTLQMFRLRKVSKPATRVCRSNFRQILSQLRRTNGRRE